MIQCGFRTLDSKLTPIHMITSVINTSTATKAQYATASCASDWAVHMKILFHGIRVSSPQTEFLSNVAEHADFKLSAAQVDVSSAILASQMRKNTTPGSSGRNTHIASVESHVWGPRQGAGLSGSAKGENRGFVEANLTIQDHHRKQ